MHNEIQRLSDKSHTLAIEHEEAVQNLDEVENQLSDALAESEALRSQLSELQDFSQNYSHEADPTIGQYDAESELEQRDASYTIVNNLQTQLDQRTAELAATEAELDALRLENYENEQYRDVNADAVSERDEQILELEEQEIRLNAQIEDLRDENDELLRLNTALRQETHDYASHLRQCGRSRDSSQQGSLENQESPAGDDDEPDPESFSDLVTEQLLRESLAACQGHRNKLEKERREEQKYVEALTASLEEARAARRVLELQLKTSQSYLQRALKQKRELETTSKDLEHVLLQNERRSDDSSLLDEAENGDGAAAKKNMQELNDELAQLRNQNREMLQRNVDLDQLNHTLVDNSGDATIEALNQQIRNSRTISEIEQSRLHKKLEHLRQEVIYAEKRYDLLVQNAAEDAIEQQNATELLDRFLGIVKAQEAEIKDLKKISTGELGHGSSAGGEFRPEDDGQDMEPGRDFLETSYEELLQENERLMAESNQLVLELQQCQAHGAQQEEKLAETQGEIEAANRINETRGSSGSPAQRGGRGGGRGRGSRASRALGTTSPKSQTNRTKKTTTDNEAESSSQQTTRASKRKAKDVSDLEILDDSGNPKPLDNNDKRFRRNKSGNGSSGLRGGASETWDTLSESELNSIYARIREWDVMTAALLSDHIGYLSCKIDSLEAQLIRAFKDRNAVEDRLRVERETTDYLTESELWVRNELEQTRGELKTAKLDLTRCRKQLREGNSRSQSQVARDAENLPPDDERQPPCSVDLHRQGVERFRAGARIPGIGRDCEVHIRRLLQEVNDPRMETELIAIFQQLGGRIVSLRQRHKPNRSQRMNSATLRRERHRLPPMPRRRRWINADGTDAEDSNSASSASFDCGDVECDGTDCFERNQLLRARRRKAMKNHNKRVKALLIEEFRRFEESDLDAYDDEPLAQRDRSRRSPRQYVGKRRSLTPSPRVGGPRLLKNSPWNSAKSSRSSAKGNAPELPISQGETVVASQRDGDAGAVERHGDSHMPRPLRMTGKRKRKSEVKVGA
ncbi:uncharacterized protein MYCFIDRAFT_76074 [Pseudocercospora fijiensis CIRAD86]|uniref:Uncharacterized protein n=1 Tax=Pseudocercospora fijiensis (strain CIRAD86) TaxID=383855 RepID=N1Q6T4_PSEFD|nr:uncharacterized protein MYCFIDRAFT_76074 [Pseudocercospora fijiensis CIRAD86]EME88245.1 hypothetical protein MYCFIDRAFT_76074 [Pseudocercospora fijiensis CIRAD86]